MTTAHPPNCFYGISRAVCFWRLKFEGAGLVCEWLSQRTARIQDSIEAWCGLALPKDVYDNVEIMIFEKIGDDPMRSCHCSTVFL